VGLSDIGVQKTLEARAREILGVSPKATPQEIRQAFRYLCRRLHPDVNQKNTSEEFLLIKEAYEYLIYGKTPCPSSPLWRGALEAKGDYQRWWQERFRHLF